MSNKLLVNSSPHIKHSETTTGVMLDVIIALLPAALFGVMIFGYYSAVLIAVCVASCVLFEYIFAKIFKNEGSVKDLSAVVTGLLLAMNLPPKFPIWMAVIGCFAAIVVVKQMFGGLGHNFVNPAIAARIILLISFPVAMTKTFINASFFGIDGLTAVTGATPLAFEVGTLNIDSAKTLFFGMHGGTIGETSAVLLLLGGIYLVIRKVIKPTIPLCFIGSVAVASMIMDGSAAAGLISILTGGVMLGAIFMATDYVTSPTTTVGQIIFGIGCGLVTVIIRSGVAVEGVSYAILFMNLLVPHIDHITVRKPFGWEAKKQ